jgi:drug/metabolite transporter (DMT)-like permease
MSSPERAVPSVSLTTLPIHRPILSPNILRLLMFAFVCVIWGTNWIAMKTAISVVPPAFFSGVRWTLAGLLLLAWASWRGMNLRVAPRHWWRLSLSAVLMVSINATIMLYGLREIRSGLAGVLTCGVTPIAMLAFAVALGQERFRRRQAAAIALGLAGILLLFGPAAFAGAGAGDGVAGGGAELIGGLLVIAGCVCYCAGTVLVRPALASVGALQAAAITNLIGGVILLVGAALFEPGVAEAATFRWGGPAWGAFFYMLLPGSLGASVVYFLLVRDWGPSRAAMYAFVSPVIAVMLGMAVFGERVTLLDIAGMALMLAAAAAALRGVTSAAR